MSYEPDLTRRQLVGATLPALGSAVAVTSTSCAPADGGSADDRAVADVTEFGARGDGRSDDHAAFVAAIAAARLVMVPPGSFRVSAPVVLRDGQILRGAGRSGWEPYSGRGTPASATRTEIVVDDGIAIDARGTNNAAISGVALRSRGARQSAWAYEPGFQPGTTGIHLAGSLQFSATDVSFHGLEVAVSGVADRGRTAQMPAVDGWSAHDCATVFRFASDDPDFTPVRDARIAAGIAAVHCGRVVDVRNCDGLRIENVRFFQCVRNAVLVERTPFVSIIGATMFETGDETVVLRGCDAVTMSGVQLVRAGFYHAPPPVQRAALLLDGCRDVRFDGVVERPMGRAFTIRDCRNLSIGAAISTPFWSTGSLGSNDGAIFIERSRSVAIDASFSGGDYWIAVWCDAESSGSVNGRITPDAFAGTVRCVQLQPAPFGHVVRSSAPLGVAPGTTVQLDTLRILMPPGGTLVSRSVETTVPGLVAQVGGQRWTGGTAEPGGGRLSLDRHILHRNMGRAAAYASIPIGAHNPGASSLTVPAGHEIRLSLAIELTEQARETE